MNIVALKESSWGAIEVGHFLQLWPSCRMSSKAKFARLFATPVRPKKGQAKRVAWDSRHALVWHHTFNLIDSLISSRSKHANGRHITWASHNGVTSCSHTDRFVVGDVRLLNLPPKSIRHRDPLSNVITGSFWSWLPLQLLGGYLWNHMVDSAHFWQANLYGWVDILWQKSLPCTQYFRHERISWFPWQPTDIFKSCFREDNLWPRQIVRAKFGKDPMRNLGGDRVQSPESHPDRKLAIKM